MGRPNTDDGLLNGQAIQCPISAYKNKGLPKQSKGSVSKGSPKYTSSKGINFTKQDDGSSSTISNNKVHYENSMYESSMTKDSTASLVSPVMMSGTLSTEEQLANLTRIV
ncbi:hypothetical protein M9H77_09060 [Catharanthus roseus]|uniref:Uncharacterized protein n=1 Tax=Catharanthus roseus TaxID=4058 RepID=A0ACC0BZL6_CATRO|nr:hypothetical protein M9H77_09060 [Catharanthus roseus]